MSEATYTFASRVQRGFTAEGDGTSTVRVSVGDKPPIEHPVTLMGPADVVGLGPGQVIRTWPKDGVHNAEPNYLALVELDDPALPWLFSRPDPAGVVHPWLMLLVVEIDGTVGDDPLQVAADGTATITVPADQRPDPRQAWLWAHGQLMGTDSVPDDPSRSLARLVCPRRLLPDKQYVACVVPTFEAGVRAAAGDEIGPHDPVRAQARPGWKPDSGEVQLPAYVHWRFGTGPAGDFESLVRRLHGVPLPPGMGRRRLRLDHPLSGLPPSGAGDLELHVALRPPGEETEPLDRLGVGADYVATLRQRLADADYDVSLLAGDAPVVGPPVHGQLPVGATARASALGTAAVPPWLSELNLDPRHRVAAGLGAEVVRRNQEHYLEQAWRQVGDVLAANRLRRRAEYSLGATRRLYDRWISRLDPADLVSVTAPVHAKVAVARAETVVGRLRDSPVPPAAASVELRRFARARGALSQGTGWQAAADVRAVAAVADRADALVQRVPLDSVATLDPPSRAWGPEVSKEILGRLVAEGTDLEPAVAATRLDAVSEVALATVPTADEVRAHVAAVEPDVDRTLSMLGLVPLAQVTDVVQPPVVEPPVVDPGRGHGHHPGPFGPFGPFEPGHLERDAPHVGRFERLGRGFDWVRPSPEVLIDTLREQPSLIEHVGDRPVLDTVRLEEATRVGVAVTRIDRSVFDQLVDGTFRQPPAPAVDFSVPVTEVGGIRTELGDAVAALAGLELRGGDAVARPGRVLADGFASLREPLLRALRPHDTILRAVNSRISALRDGDAEVLDDIMAAPDLSEPTYQQLGAISHDWLLPGLDLLPADTTTLVEANLEFVASFLVGMNHELARELLWREYPTDQRGTYARQFWTHVARRVPEDGFDLKQQLHAARRSHLRDLTGGGKDPLVLVVKGDLVQRYPGLILVAATTERKQGLRVPRGTPMSPDFVGLLEPDVLLAGFTGLTADLVRTAEAGPPDGRWWFFFAEHFTEPRFGLDETSPEATPAQWNAAAWSHVPAGDAFLTPATFQGRSLVKGDGRPETFPWGTDAASQAWATLQFPFRRGIPAADLLPPEDS